MIVTCKLVEPNADWKISIGICFENVYILMTLYYDIEPGTPKHYKVTMILELI